MCGEGRGHLRGSQAALKGTPLDVEQCREPDEAHPVVDLGVFDLLGASAAQGVASRPPSARNSLPVE
jgi:hypothetical protein